MNSTPTKAGRIFQAPAGTTPVTTLPAGPEPKPEAHLQLVVGARWPHAHHAIAEMNHAISVGAFIHKIDPLNGGGERRDHGRAERIAVPARDDSLDDEVRLSRHVEKHHGNGIGVPTPLEMSRGVFRAGRQINAVKHVGLSWHRNRPQRCHCCRATCPQRGWSLLAPIVSGLPLLRYAPAPRSDPEKRPSRPPSERQQVEQRDARDRGRRRSASFGSPSRRKAHPGRPAGWCRRGWD